MTVTSAAGFPGPCFDVGDRVMLPAGSSPTGFELAGRVVRVCPSGLLEVSTGSGTLIVPSEQVVTCPLRLVRT